MNKENFKYLSEKVGRYDQLQIMKENLNAVQVKLVNDEPLEIRVGWFDKHFNDSIQFGNMDTKKENSCFVKDEYDELMREIKDNLIDSIGMKIVEINDTMEEM